MEPINTKVEISRSFFKERPITVGINSTGEFVVKFTGKEFLPINVENLVYLFRLFEFEYAHFKNEVEAMVREFNLVNKNAKVDLPNFPFVEMIKSALYSDRDYWVEMAIPWIKEIGAHFFVNDIRSISKNKNLSQKVRHDLLRL